MKKKILIIETDQAYIGRLNSIFSTVDINAGFELIYPPFAKLDFSSGDALVKTFIEESITLLNQYQEGVIGILVDIRLFEDSDDTLGVEIAYSLKNKFPLVPVISITNHFLGEDIELFAEVTLGNVDGVLPKIYFTSENFTRNKLTKIFDVTKAKLLARYETVPVISEPFSRYSCDVVIITAMSEPEFSSLTTLFKFKPIDKKNLRFQDTSTYFELEIKRNGKKIKMVAATDDKMGMAATTSLATRMLTQFEPKFVVMLGICAGIEGRANIGDIIFAEYCWDYGSGKVFIEEDEHGQKVEKFTPYHKHYQVYEPFRKTLANLPKKAEILANIKAKSTNFSDNNLELKLRIGPFASGAAVIANKKLVEEIKTLEGKLIGFDMEAYGLFYAANNFDEKIKAISIKGVSDFGTENKNNPLKDAHQLYAANNSVLFFKYFLEKILIGYIN